MILEQILGSENAAMVYKAGYSSVISEKTAQAAAPAAVVGAGAAGAGIAASAMQWLRGILGGGVQLGRQGIGLANDSASLARNLAITGIGAGVLGGVGYHLIKERLQRGSPEEELNRKIEGIFSRREREISDKKWMDRVRSMRDDLRRNKNKMSPEEYAKKYEELVKALDER